MSVSLEPLLISHSGCDHMRCKLYLAHSSKSSRMLTRSQAPCATTNSAGFVSLISRTFGAMAMLITSLNASTTLTTLLSLGRSMHTSYDGWTYNNGHTCAWQKVKPRLWSIEQAHDAGGILGTHILLQVTDWSRTARLWQTLRVSK